MSILEEAARLVSGSRNADYGDPRDNHACTADLLNAYVRRRYEAVGPGMDEADVCVLNMLQKLSRFAWERKRDSLVDVVGYCVNAAVVLGWEELPTHGGGGVVESATGASRADSPSSPVAAPPPPPPCPIGHHLPNDLDHKACPQCWQLKGAK